MKFYFVLFILSFIATYIARAIALKMNVVDVPGRRSSHKVPTPRGGGIAFVSSWFIGIIYEHLFWNSMPDELFRALMAGIIIVIIGLVDDVWNVKPGIRLIVQVLAALLGIYFLGGLQKLDLGFMVIENIYILSGLAVIGIIWAINLFNFIDGIDGYLGSEIVFIAIAISIICLNSIVLLLGAVTLGFLIWNWQPAKIFMGDVGSTLLGFNIAILAIYFQNADKSSLVIWLIITSVFWFDATLTLLRRIRNREKLSQAHKKHAYQRIVQAGFSHQKTTLLAMAINILLGIIAYISFKNGQLLLPGLLASIIILYVIVKLIDRKKPFA